MIKYHPTLAVLQQFAQGSLPVSVSVVVAAHVEMCPECQECVAALTEKLAESELGTENALAMAPDLNDFSGFSDSEDAEDMALMIAAITDMPVDEEVSLPKTVTELDVSGKRISLPRSMSSIALKEWSGLGKLSRSRLDLDDGELRASLLHIDKGGSVPCHTHKGFEITLLLDGSFTDEMGHYQKGDFVWLDGDHTHQPVTEEGCVCLTVSSDAIRFTQGVSQLFNPIGKLIY